MEQRHRDTPTASNAQDPDLFSIAEDPRRPKRLVRKPPKALWLDVLYALGRLALPKKTVTIPALEIECDVNARLTALQTFYAKVAEVGKTLPTEPYRGQAQAIARIQQRLQNLRNELDGLRRRHQEGVRDALAGEEVAVMLSYRDALLIDTIRDIHVSIWKRRRREAEELAQNDAADRG